MSHRWPRKFHPSLGVDGGITGWLGPHLKIYHRQCATCGPNCSTNWCLKSWVYLFFEGWLYLSYRIIIHYISLYIIHIAVCNIHYLGWLGAPIPRKKKNQHPSPAIIQQPQSKYANHRGIANTNHKHLAVLIIPPQRIMCFEPRQPNRNITLWYPSFEGYHHPQHNHIQITCLWRSGRGRWWKKNLTSAWYPAPAASRAILALNSMFHLYIIINMIPIPSLNWKTQCPSPQWFSFASPAPWCIPWKPTSPCIAHLG